MPTVSVIIPAYNAASSLPRAIESVLQQTVRDLELIVVDDGSTDNTGPALHPYLDRIRYIRQENQGVAAARNTGLRSATGDFIAWLDADDQWTPDKLSLQLPRFKDSQVGIVYSDFETRYTDGQIRPSFLTNHPFAAEGQVFARYVQSRFFLPSTMILRSQCFRDAGLFDEQLRASEDVELFARILLHWHVALVNQPLTIRSEGTHNLTSDKQRTGRYTALALATVLAKETHLSPSDSAAIHAELGRQHWWLGYAAFEQGDLLSARKDLRRALRFDPRSRRHLLPLIALSFLPPSVVSALRSVKKARSGA